MPTKRKRSRAKSRRAPSKAASEVKNHNQLSDRIKTEEWPILRFPHGWLSKVRNDLLSDLSREQFCILLGKRNDFDGGYSINVIEILNPGPTAYQSNSLGHVTPRKEFVLYALSELQDRFDVDTIIDVHTHPFSSGRVAFSGVDDRDEINFGKYLDENFDDINYVSVVFSETQYSARRWQLPPSRGSFENLLIKCQTSPENILNSDQKVNSTADLSKDFLHRTSLAIGGKALKNIVEGSSIVVVGLGGLGSIIAEDLVHMGFNNLILVDDDTLEHSNLNRIVGATWQDAEDELPKVESIKKHLKAIRPEVHIDVRQQKIEDITVDYAVASSDFIIVGTDNHSSRFYAQELAFRHFIPMITAGVNISVEDGTVTDYSGEVIVVRAGDRLCLNCLERINPTQVAAESNVNSEIGQQLVARGYVEGADIKEPAVKTLNSIIAALTVEELVNQYTNRTEQSQVIVYERNNRTSIYKDTESIAYRHKNCQTCCIV